MSRRNVNINGSHWVDVYVGKRIRNMRKANKMSQTALAKEVGLTFQQIQKYENAKNRVACSTLWELARALHCGTEELLPRSSVPWKVAMQEALVS